ncbi:hypothetical protein [Methylobacterium sp. R2-1]|uniref:hypothetical protein n=1 Tax=Methylobacterium sp. R2-1 TaxID=2587064 RepID=UPI00160F0648|nr:hypothetical protein [Methylobacterium sp. R2-1]MBB2962531.1 hypothetical protein [Methylobacterium sp. R2-1]
MADKLGKGHRGARVPSAIVEAGAPQVGCAGSAACTTRDGALDGLDLGKELC